MNWGIVGVAFVLLPLSCVRPQYFSFDYDGLSGSFGGASAVSFISSGSAVFGNGVFIQPQFGNRNNNNWNNRQWNQGVAPNPRVNGQFPGYTENGYPQVPVKRNVDQYANNPFLGNNLPQPAQRQPETPRPRPNPSKTTTPPSNLPQQPAQPVPPKKPKPGNNSTSPPPQPAKNKKAKPSNNSANPSPQPAQAKKVKPASNSTPSSKQNGNKKKGPTPRNNNGRNKAKAKAKAKKRKRVSQIKYEQYFSSIFPDADNDGIEEVTDFRGRQLAEPGQHPHMGAIGFRNSVLNKTEYKCGGSLISTIYVLTAAHCADLYGEPPKYVRFGDLNLKAAEENIDPQTRQIGRIVKHPQYKDGLLYNDIALLELAKPVVFTEFVRPIRLWYHEELPATHAFAMGFGSVQFAGALTNRLTEFNLTIVPNDVCRGIMPEQENTPQGVISSQICATDYAQAGTDTFQGDSGGPLQVNFENENSGRIHGYLIGITSYGVVGSSKYPGVYTRISSFVDWIEQTAWSNEYDNYYN